MRIGSMALILCAVLGAASCGEDQDPEGARELWDRIHAEGYRSFARAPRYEMRRTTMAPHADIGGITPGSMPPASRTMTIPAPTSQQLRPRSQ